MRDTKREILSFWFEESEPQQWFQSNPDFDREIRDRFLTGYEMARDGLCESWMQDAEGCLALCLLLDQFPRNMFRNDSKAFASDGEALKVADYALARAYDQLLPPHKRRFLYLPYEHSENKDHQEKAVALFKTMKDEDPLGYDYAVRHKDVIEKFGRFPHRNAILGRKNTSEEEEYLAAPGAGF